VFGGNVNVQSIVLVSVSVSIWIRLFLEKQPSFFSRQGILAATAHVPWTIVGYGRVKTFAM
jgi:hypothetical protein